MKCIYDVPRVMERKSGTMGGPSISLGNIYKNDHLFLFLCILLLIYWIFTLYSSKLKNYLQKYRKEAKNK